MPRERLRDCGSNVVTVAWAGALAAAWLASRDALREASDLALGHEWPPAVARLRADALAQAAETAECVASMAVEWLPGCEDEEAEAEHSGLVSGADDVEAQAWVPAVMARLLEHAAELHCDTLEEVEDMGGGAGAAGCEGDAGRGGSGGSSGSGGSGGDGRGSVGRARGVRQYAARSTAGVPSGAAATGLLAAARGPVWPCAAAGAGVGQVNAGAERRRTVACRGQGARGSRQRRAKPHDERAARAAPAAGAHGR
eukprot:262210-Chlamydomonas_euryale.AAC.1